MPENLLLLRVQRYGSQGALEEVDYSSESSLLENSFTANQVSSCPKLQPDKKDLCNHLRLFFGQVCHWQAQGSGEISVLKSQLMFWGWPLVSLVTSLARFLFQPLLKSLLVRCRQPHPGDIPTYRVCPLKQPGFSGHLSVPTCPMTDNKQLTQSSQDPLGLDCLIGSSLFKIVWQAF